VGLWWDPESAGGVGFGLVTALSSRPSLPVIFAFVYDKFGLCTSATMTVSVENIKLDENGEPIALRRCNQSKGKHSW
jgi:hypothetical protein